MAKTSYDLRDFSAGTITNGDPVDIPDGAASYSLNVSPHSGIGEVTSIIESTEIMSNVPHITSMTVVNGLEPNTFDLGVNIEQFFILIDDYTSETTALDEFLNIIRQSQVLPDEDPANWASSGGNTSGGKKWTVVKTVPNYTYEISGSIDVSDEMDTTAVQVYAIPASLNSDGTPIADASQTLTGKTMEKGGAFGCIRDKTFKHDFVATTEYTIIVLENGASTGGGSPTTDFLTPFAVQFSRGGYIWGELGEELDFTPTSRGLFIASNTSVPHVQHKQRDTVNNLIKQYLEKSECSSPNSSNAINNIDQMVWVNESTTNRTKLMCAVYGVDRIWECVFNDQNATDFYEFLPSTIIQGLTAGVGGLLQTTTDDTVYSWDFEGFTIHKISIASGSSNVATEEGWTCGVAESYSLKLDDIGECFIADVAIGIADTSKAYVLFSRMGGLKGEDIILAAVDISSGGSKSIANGGLVPLYKLNGYTHVTAYTGHADVYRKFLFWDYKADVNPTGPVDFYWLASSEEQPPRYENGDYAHVQWAASVDGGKDVGWVNTDKEDICVETKAGGLAVTKHIDADHDCCWFTIEPASESLGTKWLADSGGYKKYEQVADILGLADETFGFFAGSTPDGWWTEQSKSQVLSSEKMMVSVVPQAINSTDKSLQEFRLTEAPIFDDACIAAYDECLAHMKALEEASWPNQKQSGPFIHEYWEDQNWPWAGSKPPRGRDDGSSKDDKRKKYPDRMLNYPWPTGWGWHKKTKKKWGITIKYWWWGATGWEMTNPKTLIPNERDISTEVYEQVKMVKELKNNAHWAELRAALTTYENGQSFVDKYHHVLHHLQQGMIEVYAGLNQTRKLDPLRDHAVDGAIFNGFKDGEPWAEWSAAQALYEQLFSKMGQAGMSAMRKQTRAYPQDQIKHHPLVANTDMPSVWAQFQGYDDGSYWNILGSLNHAGNYKHSEGRITSTGTGFAALSTTEVSWQDRHTGIANGVFKTEVPNFQGSIETSQENQDVTEGWALYKPTTHSIQKRGESGTDGNTTESLLVTMYTGDLTLTQFNFAADVASTPANPLTNTIFDAGDIKVGLFLDGAEPSDSTAEEAYFKSGDTWLYNMSFLYDGYQEGPLMATPVTIGPLSANSTYLNLGVRFQLTNPRITHVQIYRKTDVAAKYRLLKSIPIDTEWDIKSATDPSVVTTANDVKMHSSIDFSCRDEGQDGISYEALVGLPETLRDTIVNYAESESIGNYLFVTRATHPKLIATDKMIFRSQPGKFSLFNWAQDYLGIPEAAHTLVGAHNRLYAFSDKTMFKIDPYNLLLEQEYEGMGIPGKRSVTIIDGIMYLGNKNGIFIFDGNRFTKISQTIDDKYLSYWDKAPLMRVTLMNDKKYNALMVSFDNMGSYSRDVVPADTLVYSIDKRKWDIWILPKPIKAHCINEFNELMVCASASNVVNWDAESGDFLDKDDNVVTDRFSLYTLHTDPSSSKRLEWSTKAVTMNSPSRRKKLKSVKLWGKNITIGSIETEDGHLFMSTEALARAKLTSINASHPYTLHTPLPSDASNPGWAEWGEAECIISTQYGLTGRYKASLDKAVHTGADEVETVIWDKADHSGISDDDWRAVQKAACATHLGYWVEAADGTYNTSGSIREMYSRSSETSRPYRHNADKSYQFWKFTGDSVDSFTDFSTTFKRIKIHIHSTEDYSWSNNPDKTPVLEGISLTYRDKTLK